MDALALATIALAFVTVLLAVATVFGREIRGWLIRPRLRLSGGSTARYVVRTPSGWLDQMSLAPAGMPETVNVPPGETAPWYWIRMEVSNALNNSETAQDVEIFIEEMQQRSGVEGFKTLPNVGLNLCWSWGPNTIFTDILPGATKFFNIGHVTHPDGRKDFPDYAAVHGSLGQGQAFLTLASFPRVPGYEAIFEPGTYRICLLIGGKNFPTTRHWVQFEFDRVWTPQLDLMCKSLSLKIEN